MRKLQQVTFALLILLSIATTTQAIYGFGRSASSGNCGYYDNPIPDPSCGSGSYYVDQASSYWPPAYREINRSVDFDYRYKYQDTGQYVGLQEYAPFYSRYYHQYGNYFNYPYQDGYYGYYGYYDPYRYDKLYRGYNTYNPYYDAYYGYGYPYTFNRYRYGYIGYYPYYGSYYDYLSPGYTYYGT